RRHARGVEARAVEHACDHGSGMSPAMTRTRRWSSRAAVRRGRLRLFGLATLLAAGVVAVIVFLGPLNKAFREITLPLRHEDIIRQQAREKRLDPALIAAVIYQ